MGPTSVLSAIRHEEGSKGGERLADHLLIPGVDWIDQYRLNEMLVQGTYLREKEFVDKETWKGMQMDGKAWFYFDRGTSIYPLTHLPELCVSLCHSQPSINRKGEAMSSINRKEE
jgi:hypothetical protein